MEIVERPRRERQALEIIDEDLFGKLTNTRLGRGGIQRIGRMRENRSDPVLLRIGEKRLHVRLVERFRRSTPRIAGKELEHVRTNGNGGLPHCEITAA